MASFAAAPLLAAFMAVFLCGCTQAIIEPEVKEGRAISCVGETMESIKSRIQIQAGSFLDILPDEKTEVFMAAFNRSPPPTQVIANEVMLVVSQADGRTLIIMGRDGCLVQTAYSLWQFVEKWKQGIIPGPDEI
jgi:hypothetical protein